MFYKLVIALLLMVLPAAVFAADTLYIAGKVTLMLPGVSNEQVIPDKREIALYQQAFQIQLVRPLVVSKGSIVWWDTLQPRYWEQNWQLGLSPVGEEPSSWWAIPEGQLSPDTLLPLGSKLGCWLRNSKTGQQVQLFTLVRPLLQPQFKGYQFYQPSDTANLAMRVAQVGSRNAGGLSWKPMVEELPRLPPGATAEFYLLLLPGVADSSLEYRIEEAGDTLLRSRWQLTGHLLRLPHLQDGKQYRVSVRYKDMPKVVSLAVQLELRWYQQTRWKWISVLVLMLLTGLFLYLRNRKRMKQIEQRHRALQDKLQRLHSQLNPHFLYNALSSIAGLVSMQQYDKANTYLSEFGHLLRGAIKYSQQEQPYTLHEELQMLERYCQLEQMRFGFQYKITTSPSLTPSEVLLPPLLVQPLVENAILHGAQALAEKGEISISYNQYGSDFEVRVCDNGPGVHKRKAHEGFGLGLNITRERIKYISHLTEMDIRFTLTRENDLSVAAIRFSNWFD
ncbi:MAG TPA: histidine kinase [Phnomibacter sp.]|nr:histidine kinase [Phnomibacter sp.]